MPRPFVLRMLPLIGMLLSQGAWAGEGDGTAQVGTTSTDSPEAPATGAATATEPAGKSVFELELLTVQQDVNALKERVFKSKVTLELLKEMVIEGATLGARIAIYNDNKLSSAYQVNAIQYFLDGKNVYSKSDPNGVAGLEEIKVHEQAVPPGKHSLTVNLVLQGHGKVINYINNYSIKLQSSYSFEVQDGRFTTVHVVLDEKGGALKDFVEKPDVHYEEKVDTLRQP